MTADAFLIATKFAPPRLGRKAVQRARLLGRLRDSRECRLIVVTGSAGFGKTTLLAQWRQELLQAGAEVSWLQLAPGDAQLRSFWTYFSSALAHLGIGSEEEALLLGDDQNPRLLEAAVAAAVNHASTMPKELFLFVDDYHYVSDPAIHELLYLLVSRAPDNLHIVLATRSQPPIPTGRLLGLGQFTEIVAEELPFDAQEVADFVARHVTTRLRPEDARLIYEHSLGWPAALQLVAIQLNRSPRASTTPAALTALSERASDLGRYLEEDVMRHLAPDLVEFLEAVSVCPRFDADLAAEITARPDALQLIQQIEGENLFLSRIELDGGRDWLRMHRLFADFLGKRRARHGNEWEQRIHRRASRWFAAQSLIPEAVRHARLANDLEFAVEVVTRAATGLHRLAHMGTLLRWIEELSPDAVQRNPKLLALGCWSQMLSGNPDAAEAWSERLALYNTTSPANEDAAEIARQLAVVRAGIAIARDDSEGAVAHLAIFGDSLPEDPFQASLALTVWTLSDTAAGHFDLARRRFQRWRAGRGEKLVSDHQIVAAASLFVSALMEGDACYVERECPVPMAQADEAYGRQSSCASICAALLASAYVERDRLVEARDLASSLGEMLRIASPEVMIQVTLAQARLSVLDEDPQGALAVLIQSANHFHQRRLDRGEAMMLAAQAAIHLGHGDIRQAKRVQARLDVLAGMHRDASGWRGEIPSIAALAAARLALAERRGADALISLAEAGIQCEQRNRRRTRVIVDLLSCAACLEQEQLEPASGHLAAALSAAHSLGLVRTVLDELAQLHPTKRDRISVMICERSAGGDPAAREYATRLSVANPELPLARVRSTTVAPVPATSPAQVGMTDREAEILRLLSQSMSNKRIAQTLSLGVETVKWNLRNIYSKIGVSSRYAALTWAKDRGLI